jgi:phenylacetate-CoA ligase
MNLATAELSVIASRTYGQPYDLAALECLVDALLDARRGVGTVKADGSNLLQAPPLTDEERREIILRRFRLLAARAAAQTPYYGALFQQAGLDPAQLSWDDIPRIPVTSKDALRNRPEDFVCRDARPVFETTTTGTTGRPTRVFFSMYELRVSTLTSAIENLIIGDIVPGDIGLTSSSSRATLGNTVGAWNTLRVGALLVHGGQVEPATTLALLAQPYDLPGMAPKVNQVLVYPSYLGELVETGKRLGYKPSDFGLKRIDTGGEIVTHALRRRAQEFFGNVPYWESYGMTETWGMGGQVCEEGHLHYGGGWWEFLNADTGAPAQPGEVATMVCTPLPPSRDTTLVIRYDTQDLVRMLREPPTCSLKAVPAVDGPLGKRALSVRHEDGWTVPRQVLEALESVDALPLPARCGFWAVPGGVAVEVVAPDDAAVLRSVGASLEAQGVPLRELHRRDDRGQLQHAIPLRGDLRELSF